MKFRIEVSRKLIGEIIAGRTNPAKCRNPLSPQFKPVFVDYDARRDLWTWIYADNEDVELSNVELFIPIFDRVE